MSQTAVSVPPVSDADATGGRFQFSIEAIFGLILACFIPLLCLHFRQLWLYEHYQYFPFVLLAFPFLIARNRAVEPTPRSGGRWQWAWIIGGLVVLALAVIGWSPNLAAVAFVITAGGILWHYYCQGDLKRFLPIWLVLFFLIKLPLNMDVDLVFWLQGTTSKMSSRLLDILGVNHFLAGHNLRVANMDFAVEEACSGIQSLFSLLAMTAVILAFYRRSLLHYVLLLLAAVFWACMINVVRVTTVVLAHEKMGVDLTAETPHALLGLFLFVGAIGMMLCTDRLLLFFTADDTVEGEDDGEIELFKSLSTKRQQPASDQTVGSSVPPELGWTQKSITRKRLFFGVLASFILLAVLQLAVLALTNSGARSLNPDDPRLTAAFTEDTLPEASGRWVRKGFQKESRSLTNYQGRNSVQWVYESDLGKIAVGVDYPFLGWHELTGCYIAEGCSLDVREVVDGSNAVRATITTPSGGQGRLVFSEFLTNGNPLLPLGNDAGTLAYWRSRVQTALIRQFASFQNNSASFQVQLLYHFDQPMSESTEQELLQIHREMTDQIIQVVREATKSNE